MHIYIHVYSAVTVLARPLDMYAHEYLSIYAYVSAYTRLFRCDRLDKATLDMYAHVYLNILTCTHTYILTS